jgi:hypothetical protein
MPFTIHIKRRGVDEGRLTFRQNNISVDTTCWWDPAVKVDAGTYMGYATRMTSKTDGQDGGKREAIWLGEKIPVNGKTRNSSEIFIHKGKNAAWSDGCVVCAESEVLKIWNAITPKEQRNVTIVITDETEQPKPAPINYGYTSSRLA